MWSDVQCNQTNNFVCKKNINFPQTTTILTPTDASKTTITTASDEGQVNTILIGFISSAGGMGAVLLLASLALLLYKQRQRAALANIPRLEENPDYYKEEDEENYDQAGVVIDNNDYYYAK